MKKGSFTFLFLLFSYFMLQAQSLEIKFDLSNATFTIQLLRQRAIRDGEINNFLALSGTQGLLKKVNAHPDTLRSALLKIIQEQPLTTKEQKFQFRNISKYLDTLDAFIKRLSQQQSGIETSIRNALLPYVPQGKKMSVTVYGLLGGASMGYTLGDDTAFILVFTFIKTTCQPL